MRGEERVAAVLAAGGVIIDDSELPGLTVFADQEGNRGVLAIDTSGLDSDPLVAPARMPLSPFATGKGVASRP